VLHVKSQAYNMRYSILLSFIEKTRVHRNRWQKQALFEWKNALLMSDLNAIGPYKYVPISKVMGITVQYSAFLEKYVIWSRAFWEKALRTFG